AEDHAKAGLEDVGDCRGARLSACGRRRRGHTSTLLVLARARSGPRRGAASGGKCGREPLCRFGLGRVRRPAGLETLARGCAKLLTRHRLPRLGSRTACDDGDGRIALAVEAHVAVALAQRPEPVHAGTLVTGPDDIGLAADARNAREGPRLLDHPRSTLPR